jgi:type IV pilus assembly protein PilA
MTATKNLLAVIFISALVSLFPNLAVSAEVAPQTARQALLEMFFSKTPRTFEKHLPQATRAALRKAGTTSGASMLNGFSALTSQLTARGQQLQTFEAGPTLVLMEDSVAHSKFEILVERDDLRGDEDEIELSFHASKDGETQTAGGKFRLTLTMKQEAASWRLNEVSFTVGVSLTDPQFLKAITTNMRAAATSTGISEAPASGPPTMTTNSAMTSVNEAAAVGGVRTLNTAEISYAATFPGRGFTCALSDLGGMGAGSGPTEHQAMMIDPRLAGGRKNGYVFALSGCDGTPASRYSITAVPADPSSGTRAFCSDESAVIRFSADGKANSCLSIGKPLQ